MTVRSALDEFSRRLAASGVDSPMYEVRLMFETFFVMTRLRLTDERERQLSEKEEACLISAVERRCKGEPIQYILGKWEFMDREYFEAEAYIDAFLELDGILPEESLAGGIKLNGKTIAIPAENCPYLTEAGIKGKNLFVGIPCETDALRKQKYADASAEASKRLISEMVK